MKGGRDLLFFVALCDSEKRAPFLMENNFVTTHSLWTQ